MPEHLHIDQPHKALFDNLLAQVLLLEALLERADFIDDDAVFFLLALGFPNGLHKVEKVLGQV
eukprot:CAMPEP_0202113722 /NCGR_PEP_ID=MMETSP0965-20130614/34526_1 /ASSEMBLY_ACC=CAM_ASM_000507 /TAXON_ID=4773 /ORGANISM="Schizochytrium aggregatum, Strain ATCC28209" /LENGTH=62 /DNA_ID=CAMNT_0048683361 /DNA_START=106 /DNA_END=290 /DNA_ORIENTATION=-